VRTYAVLSIALLLTSCAGRASSSSSPTPEPTPLPLRSCEVRTLNLDGAELVVQANVDDSVASIVVVHAPDEATSERAYDDAKRYFGTPQPDTRTRIEQIKDGLSQMTDLCGRPVVPGATPSISPSP
jgi:hypothetical protein